MLLKFIISFLLIIFFNQKLYILYQFTIKYLNLIFHILLFVSGITDNALYRKILFDYIYYLISFFTYVMPYIVVIVCFFRAKL